MELWLCLSCGWVACSDDSPGRHARAHYEETDHPIAAALRRHGSYPRWCHVHQRAV
ncbi:MAG TPA: UBP-type zinc finger domain-containing protein [Streptosporangiaceae bacterium]